LVMEAVSSSEMLANIYQTIQYNIPEDNRIHRMMLLTVADSIKIQFYFLSRYSQQSELFLSYCHTVALLCFLKCIVCSAKMKQSAQQKSLMFPQYLPCYDHTTRFINPYCMLIGYLSNHTVGLLAGLNSRVS
jgi:hypothetical protein